MPLSRNAINNRNKWLLVKSPVTRFFLSKTNVTKPRQAIFPTTEVTNLDWYNIKIWKNSSPNNSQSLCGFVHTVKKDTASTEKVILFMALGMSTGYGFIYMRVSVQTFQSFEVRLNIRLLEAE